MYKLPPGERFEREVLEKYNVYNGIFLTLPFDAIHDTGSLLPLFTTICQRGFENGETPDAIVNFFFEKYLEDYSPAQRISLLFRFIQYVERQVVLFDAVEDAAFSKLNNLEGPGTLVEAKENAMAKDQVDALQGFLRHFTVRTVLTAHPTQFYPGSVLGIITDLTKAIAAGDVFEIRQLLSQLGKTPFIQKEKPSPYDEASSLTWYLERVFYDTVGDMATFVNRNILGGETSKFMRLGFWPGGDRDGNPFVTSQITLKVADRLQTSLLKCYYSDIRKLKRKLTFPGVDDLVTDLENKIYRSAYYASADIFITLPELLNGLRNIHSIVKDEHQSLYLGEIESFIWKVELFGLFFASLDIRQNSRIHDKAISAIAQSRKGLPVDYMTRETSERIQALTRIGQVDFSGIGSEELDGILDAINAMRTIQDRNGEEGCNRYIISNNESALNVMETLAFFKMAGWENPTVDIVPLFEAIDDLKGAAGIMETLYNNPVYAEHLARRNHQQTVMLGFSDGTKDGGYLMANWSIFRAKEAITEVSRRCGVKVVFFDGRGGPPSRGGGKTHKFYASQGSEIENHEIQITVQGQTISSNFGTLDSCRFNLENLVTAGFKSKLDKQKNTLSVADRELIQKLAEIGYGKYSEFRNHPKFIPYLENRSTLKYYSRMNIGSRPAKRAKSDELIFEDLRAIPFVVSWSQLKQNVPGFFGVGTALQHFEEDGRWDELKQCYERSLFFRTLLENSMMSVAKSFLPLTQYMQNDPEYGKFWQIIHDEYQLTKRLLLKISGHGQLMENYPDGRASVAIREQIVLPLLVIQQHALIKINNGNLDPDTQSVYEKLVVRSLYGNTNASRNSA